MTATDPTSLAANHRVDGPRPDTTTDPAPPAGTAAARRVVVVGFGMAGARFVDEVVTRQSPSVDPGSSEPVARPCSVTVVGGEPYPAYNRVLLSDVVAGRADIAGLALADPAAAATRGVDVRLGRHVLAVRLPPTGAGQAILDDGTRIPFDRLVLATGAAPVVPPLDGLDPDAPPVGVTALRTLDDARAIVAACSHARRAVVLGGGPLGVEAARGLARRGLSVEVLQSAGHLLAGVLDDQGGAVLGRAVRALGVRVRTGAVVRAVTSRARRLTGVLLDGGEHVPADLLVVACGVRPRTGLAERAGLAVGRGVLIDDALASSDPRVLAIGDCAEHAGSTPGLVAPAWDMARIAADLVTGARPTARYTGHAATVRLKAADVDVTVVGDTAPGPWTEEPGLQVVQLLEPAAGRYVKAVIRGRTVVGAAVVGAPRTAAELRLLVERGAPAPARTATLLLPDARVDHRGAGSSAVTDPTTIPDRATICRCNGVSKGSLVAAWTAGARGPGDLAQATRATTGCGTCADAVAGIASWLASCDPGPGLATDPARDDPGTGTPGSNTPDSNAPGTGIPNTGIPSGGTETSVPTVTGGPR